MITAIRIIMPVPTIAFAIPPPDSPADNGSLVKKFQSSERPPFHTRKPRIKNSIETVITVHSAVIASITLLTPFLRAVSPIIQFWTLSR
jgi:hypothetical protein